MKLVRSLWMIQKLILCCLLASGAAQAQIVPDGTLENERSQVVPMDLKRDRIEGGALRGVNLFHSFLDFNVSEGRGAYFANPTTVQNIFSRVTGSNLSKIDGTLGVLGKANLFLLNPNGIIFGPKAQLDVSGSFFASTANGFKFSDGSEFSATNPQEAPLLMVNLTPGLQRGGIAGAISNEGKLTAGKDLTLSGGTVTSTGQLSAPQGQLTVEATTGDTQVKNVTAQTATLYANNNLILEESQLRTTGDLNLLAQNTVRVRDSVANPFVAQAGGNLLIQGNQGIDILALNHPQTPFVSGGNISLVSDGIISGDGHFSSGGNFQIRSLTGRLANFTSLYDPIISSNGDVNIAANYVPQPPNGLQPGIPAASLLIESRGNVQIQGTVNITVPDTVSSFVGEDVVLRTQPGLIIRSGQANLVYGADQIPSAYISPIYTGETVPAGITFLGNVSVSGGPVRAIANTGNVEVRGEINTYSNNSNGGLVDLRSETGNLIIRGRVNASTTANGTAESPVTFNGGDIRFFAGGDIVVDQSAGLSPYYSGWIQSVAQERYNAGNGGTISFIANGKITIARSLIYNNSGISPSFTSDGDVLFVSDRSQRYGGLGKSGDITFQAKDITIIDSRIDVNAYGDRSTGIGDIIVKANDGGRVRLYGSQILAESYANPTPGTLANQSITSITGGSVLLSNRRDPSLIDGVNLPSTNENINISPIVLDEYFPGKAIISSRNYGSTTSGNILIDGSNSIDGNSFVKLERNSIVTTAAKSTSSVQGGTITIQSTDGEVTIKDSSKVDAKSESLSALSGDISIGAGKQVSATNSEINSSTSNIIASGYSRISIQSLREGGSVLLDRSKVTVRNSPPQLGDAPKLAGDIYINARNRIEITNSSEISGDGNFGRIFIGSSTDRWDIDTESPLKVVIDSSNLTTKNRVTDSNNRTVDVPNIAGDIRIRAKDEIPINNGQISAKTFSEGTAGDVELRSGKITLTNKSKVDSETQGSGGAGSVSVIATDALKNGIKLSFAEQLSSIDLIPISPGNTIKLDKSTISASTILGSAGKESGSVNVRGYSLLLENDSELASKTSGNGIAGDVKVSVGDFVEVLSGSKLNARTESGANAGIITVAAPNKVTVDGFNSQILTEAVVNGNSGSIEIKTREINVQNGARISAESNTGIGKFITLDGLETLNLTNGSITASTKTGTAGNLEVTSADSVKLNGRSSLTVRAENGGTAGNLNINTNKLTLNGRPGAVADEDKARISVSSRTGQAGNLAITANTISLDNGQLTAETGASDPSDPSGEPTGNVYLNVQKTPDKLVFSSPIDALLLKNESLISATALEKATGGNVYINANWIFGFYPTGKDGSDITANAKFGSGGRVDIRKEGIFGLEYRRQPTPLNDITASSEFGQQGTVQFRGIDVDPTRGISPLPTVPVDPSNQINTTCTPNSTRAESRFVSVGRGGLPTNPGDPLTATATLSRLATLDSPSTAPDHSTLPPSDRPLVEAQTWVKLPNGRIRLVSQTPNSLSSWQNTPGCHGQ
jgi:filamentous hemagglutinin family protein